jgi:prickle
MAEHGFLQPNPILFDLETRKPKPVLGHELGLGAACSHCGTNCAGFQLHFWRKVCQNCRCGKIEHGVQERQDHGHHFVGKICERPLRTKEEECTFIYGEVASASCVDDKEEVVLDWAPPGVATSLARKYLKSLPEGHVSIQGSEGALRRKKQLEKQFPLHDVEPGICHQLSRGEINTMNNYVENVKKNVAGQGIVEELGECTGDITERVHRDLKQMSPSPPLPLPPPMHLINAETLSYTLAGTHLDKKLSHVFATYPTNMGTYHATPYNGNDTTNGRNHQRQVGLERTNDSTLKDHHYQNKPLQFNSEDLYVNRPNVDCYRPGNLNPIPAHKHENNNSWFCSGCNMTMLPGEIAVFAERAGRNKCWHPACFSCVKCGEMLEDLLYFFSDGELFCARDFASLMNIPRCAACDELIFSEEYTGAEDRFWHVKHFCCWLCDRALAGHKYIPVEGMPHCLACWQKQHGKTCFACKGVIDPQGQRVSLGDHHWHVSPACFKCGVCQASLLGGKMSMRSGTLLCSSQCGQVLASKAASNSIMGQLLRENPSKPGVGPYSPSTPLYGEPYQPPALNGSNYSNPDLSVRHTGHIPQDMHHKGHTPQDMHHTPQDMHHTPQDMHHTGHIPQDMHQPLHGRSASYSTFV